MIFSPHFLQLPMSTPSLSESNILERQHGERRGGLVFTKHNLASSESMMNFALSSPNVIASPSPLEVQPRSVLALRNDFEHDSANECHHFIGLTAADTPHELFSFRLRTTAFSGELCEMRLMSGPASSFAHSIAAPASMLAVGSGHLTSSGFICFSFLVSICRSLVRRIPLDKFLQRFHHVGALRIANPCELRAFK